MRMFEYKPPYIYKDKANKKWCIRYSIKYPGDNDFVPVKEYGKVYELPKPLNSIENLKERDKVAKVLLGDVEYNLRSGVDKRNPVKVLEIIEAEIKETKKFSYDDCVDFYFKLLGYDKPKPNQVETVKWRTYFFGNQFKKFVVSKGLEKNIRLITKIHLLEFMNFYHLHPDPKIKWSNNTYNDKRILLFGFFNKMMQQDRVEDNPVAKIPSVPKETTERFTIFTKQERDIIFDYFDKKDVCIAMMLRITYYSYIRSTETLRLKVGDFNLQTRKIAVRAENAKGQKDGLIRWVIMTPQLKEAVETYLNSFPNQPDFYIVGKKMRPSKFPLLSNWKRKFNIGFDVLKAKHPKLFQAEGLTPYSFKHSGVTDFVNANFKDKSKTDVLRYVQAQCRHEKFATTEKYLKQLELDMDIQDTFIFD